MHAVDAVLVVQMRPSCCAGAAHVTDRLAFTRLAVRGLLRRSATCGRRASRSAAVLEDHDATVSALAPTKLTRPSPAALIIVPVGAA